MLFSSIIGISESYGVTIFDNSCRYVFFDDSVRDSVSQEISGKKFIFYDFGHYVKNWAILIKADIGYRVISGQSDRPIVRNDTILSDCPLLEWGMDNMAQESKKLILEPLSVKGAPLYSRFILFSEKGVSLFEHIDFNYTGKGSKKFNKKLDDLLYFMLWYAGDDEWRQLLPRPSCNTHKIDYRFEQP